MGRRSQERRIATTRKSHRNLKPEPCGSTSSTHNDRKGAGRETTQTKGLVWVSSTPSRKRRVFLSNSNRWESLQRNLHNPLCRAIDAYPLLLDPAHAAGPQRTLRASFHTRVPRNPPDRPFAYGHHQG